MTQCPSPPGEPVIDEGADSTAARLEPLPGIGPPHGSSESRQDHRPHAPPGLHERTVMTWILHAISLLLISAVLFTAATCWAARRRVLPLAPRMLTLGLCLSAGILLFGLTANGAPIPSLRTFYLLEEPFRASARLLGTAPSPVTTLAAAAAYPLLLFLLGRRFDRSRRF